MHLSPSPKEVIFMHIHEFYPLSNPWQKWGTICGFGCRKKLIFPLRKQFFVLSGPNISPVGFFPTCDKILWGWLKENKSSNIGNWQFSGTQGPILQAKFGIQDFKLSLWSQSLKVWMSTRLPSSPPELKWLCSVNCKRTCLLIPLKQRKYRDICMQDHCKIATQNW